MFHYLHSSLQELSIDVRFLYLRAADKKVNRIVVKIDEDWAQLALAVRTFPLSPEVVGLVLNFCRGECYCAY